MTIDSTATLNSVASTTPGDTADMTSVIGSAAIENVLRITGLQVAYGGIQAVKGIDIEVNRGELITLIGANGAGKTTALKAITGTLPDCRVDGHISYLGKPIKGLHSFELVKQRLAMVPEGRGVFTRMSILENLMMGAYTRNDKAGIAADIG